MEIYSVVPHSLRLRNIFSKVNAIIDIAENMSD